MISTKLSMGSSQSVEPNRPLLFALVFIGAWAFGIAKPIFLDLILSLRNREFS